MAVAHQRDKALVGLESDELVGVSGPLKEDFDDGVEKWLHHALKDVEHVRQCDQSNARDSRAEGVRELYQDTHEALHLVSCLEDQ